MPAAGKTAWEGHSAVLTGYPHLHKKRLRVFAAAERTASWLSAAVSASGLRKHKRIWNLDLVESPFQHRKESLESPRAAYVRHQPRD